MAKNQAWKRKLRLVSKREPSKDEIPAVLAEINNQPNDRGAALIASAAVEMSLSHFIESWIVPDLNSDEENGLFGSDAPLSSFSDKIKVAYAFGLIDKDLRENLETLRLIRNAFAHSILAIDFKTEEIAKACENLTLGEGRYTTPPPKENPARAQFIANGGALMFSLLRGKKGDESNPTMPIGFDR
jgi:DNA-binding MltR family transcriptional regulator